jgi:hypothetical protein
MSTKELQRDIEGAVKSAFNPHPSVYRRVAVLLMHFDNDDLGCEAPEKDLADTFRNFYGYYVKQITFRNHQKPHIVLNQALLKFDEGGYTERGCLIILVFSGHGMATQVGKKTVLKVG